MKKQTQVFMLEDINMQGNSYGMDHFYSVDREDAGKLVSEGKAIEYENNELSQYDRTITASVEKFRKEYDKLSNSLDPRYKSLDFFADETGKLREEMETEVKRLQGEYAEVVKDVRNQAHQERANLTRNITDSDEKGAKQLVNELVSDAHLNGITSAITRIEDDMQYFSEGRRQAIANELYRLVDIADMDDRSTKRRLRSLSNRLREDSNGVEMAARMANAMPDHVGSAFTRLKVTHPMYKRR